MTSLPRQQAMSYQTVKDSPRHGEKMQYRKGLPELNDGTPQDFRVEGVICAGRYLRPGWVEEMPPRVIAERFPLFSQAHTGVTSQLPFNFLPPSGSGWDTTAPSISLHCRP